MESARPMTITCKLCGSPLELPDLGGTPFDALMAKCAAGVVHDKCAREAESARVAAITLETNQNRSKEAMRAIPPLFHDTDPNRLTRPWQLAALRWQYGPRGLCLYGPTGSGKTRIAYLLLKRELLAGRTAEALTHGEFMRDATRAACDQIFARGFVSRLQRVDLLVIDDIGKARLATADGVAKAAATTLFDVIDHRAQQQLPTVYTTNATGKDFEAEWGDHGASFARRIRDFCECIRAK